MRPTRKLPIIAAALFAAACGCQGQPPAKPGPAGRRDAGQALKPITIDPAPTCDLGAEPASRPRGTVIALYHTANVVGEVEPCG